VLEGFGADGAPVERAEMAAREIFTYDDRGNMTDAEIFGVDGRPGNRKGVAHIKKVFDDRSKVRQVEFFGPDSKPAVNDVGSAKTTFEYDARGNEIERSLFGVDGKPTLGTTGAATQQNKYDDRGNLIERAYFGVDDQPIVAHVGYVRVDNLYDPRNHQIESAFFGTDGKAMATPPLGFARITATYDDWGEVLEQHYFDPAEREIAVEVAIVRVLPGSLAQRLELAAGDRFLTYAGRKVTSQQQLIDLVGDPWLNDPRNLELRRGSQILTFQVPPGRLGIELKLALADAPPAANPQ